jgi:putative transposase
MTNTTTKPDSLQPAVEMAVDLFDNWFDPIETEVRARAREFIEEMIRGELDTVLARPRYSRSKVAGNEGRTGIAGHRHGSGTFGPIEIAVPRSQGAWPQKHALLGRLKLRRSEKRKGSKAVVVCDEDF